MRLLPLRPDGRGYLAGLLFGKLAPDRRSFHTLVFDLAQKLVTEEHLVLASNAIRLEMAEGRGKAEARESVIAQLLHEFSMPESLARLVVELAYTLEEDPSRWPPGRGGGF